MLYLGKDGSGHCPQTIAECAVQIGISYGLLTSFPEKNSFCCNNEEWLFQIYVDIFVNDLCKQVDQYNWKELGFCSDTEDEYIPPYIPPGAYYTYYPGGQKKFCRNGCRYSSIRKACISMKNGKKC